ncbi:DUF4232 domain-containing protein [Nocardioides sp. MH1]|uniref:DUF4232 domain-containing protein n=1 Tax=Nocardioides sp. MH1 TaxID=3242490 RepID=UPI0035219E49
MNREDERWVAALRRADGALHADETTLALVTREVRRRRGRRSVYTVLAAAAAVAVLAAGVSRFALDDPPSVPAPPSSNTSSSQSASPTTTPSDPQAAKTCTTEQLKATWKGTVGVQAGSRIVWIGLVNTSGSACALPSRAPHELSGVDSDGAHHIPTKIVESALWGIEPVRVLPPDKPAGFELNLPGPGVCSPYRGAATYSRIRLDLGTGAPLVVQIDTDDPLNVSCPHIDMSAIGTSPDDPNYAQSQSAPPCHATQLSATVRHNTDGASSHIANLVDLANVSDRTCLLEGYPSLVVVTEAGHDPITATRGSYFPSRSPGPVDPGDTVTLVVETTVACADSEQAIANAPRYHHIRITLNGQALEVDATRGLYVACGVRFGELTTWK